MRGVHTVSSNAPEVSISVAHDEPAHDELNLEHLLHDHADGRATHGTGEPPAPAADRTAPLHAQARLLVAVAATGLACAPSLATLPAQFRYSAPAGELLLVPVLVPLLLALTVHRQRGLWNGRLGHADLVLALALAGAALLVAQLDPSPDLNGVRLARPDLLAVPIVLAAFCVLLLGMRVIVAGALPLLFGVLVWPFPLALLESVAVTPLTEATFRASSFVVASLGQGRPVDGAGHLLRVGTGPGSFEIAVAPACAGLTGIVGFVLIGLAAQSVLRGPALRRLLWLGTGIAMIWCAAVMRVVAIVMAGNYVGREFAIDTLHPVVGVALDAAVAVIMLLCAKRFSLSLHPGEPSAAAVQGAAYAVPSAASVCVRLGMVGLIAVTFGLLGVAPVAADTAARTIVPTRATSLHDVQALGDAARFVSRQDWTRTYFGDDSDWNRYAFTAPVTGRRVTTVWVDALDVASDEVLRLHSDPACYAFSNATITDVTRVDIVPAVTAQTYTVRQSAGDTWSVLSWQWPVRTAAQVRYERLTLLASVGADTTSDAAVRDMLRRSATTIVEQRLASS